MKDRKLASALMVVIGLGILAGCGGPSGSAASARASASPSAETGDIVGVVVAGPTCPVVTDPPDPACDDRPVEGAVILLLDDAGTEVARTTSAADGSFRFSVAPGTYRMVPQPVEGLMGTAEEQRVDVIAGASVEQRTVAYDTGIR